eukprot:10643353-Lingulodinium_polyedra.AAC.1
MNHGTAANPRRGPRNGTNAKRAEKRNSKPRAARARAPADTTCAPACALTTDENPPRAYRDA